MNSARVLERFRVSTRPKVRRAWNSWYSRHFTTRRRGDLPLELWELLASPRLGCTEVLLSIFRLKELSDREKHKKKHTGRRFSAFSAQRRIQVKATEDERGSEVWPCGDLDLVLIGSSASYYNPATHIQLLVIEIMRNRQTENHERRNNSISNSNNNIGCYIRCYIYLHPYFYTRCRQKNHTGAVFISDVPHNILRQTSQKDFSSYKR